MEVKLAAMEALAAGLSASEVGELIGASKTAINAWRRAYETEGASAFQRMPATPAARKRCKALEERIVTQRQEHPEHGVRRIRDDLRREEGLEVSAETVRQTVNEAGLGNDPVQPHRRPPQIRRFERSCPNALWQIDIFTFQLKRMYPVYLIGVIDDHSRYIVGHGLYRQQTAEAVLEVVKGAIGEFGAPREILSDNGRQFVSWRGMSRFQHVLKQQGIGHVRSAPQHPMTLGKIERFWQTLWKEFLEEAVFASFADACQRLSHWVGYYNHQRPHQGMDGACPADRFYGVAGDVEEAIKHGCQENALRLALGQEPQPPLYLLGKLGGTDVRVTRRGEEIEVKLGDTVHEVIRLGAPYRIEPDGTSGRRAEGEVAGPERGGAVPGGGVGPEGGDADHGAVRDLRGEPADAVPGHGCGGPGGDGGLGAEDAWPEADAGDGPEAAGAGAGEGAAGEGTGAHGAAVRHREDDPGPGAEDRPGGAAAGGTGLRDWGKKAASAQEEMSEYEAQWACWLEREGGAGE
jgi:transposase InsO family protein